MILGQDLLIELRLNLKLSKYFIKADDEYFNVYTMPMVDLGTHILKDLNTRKYTHEEYFTNSYVKEVYES